MQIIASTAARFFNPAVTIEEVNKAGDKVKVTDRSLHNSYTVYPNARPQGAPDWIQQDPMFALLVKDEKIIPIAVLTTTAPAEPVKPIVGLTSQPATGWGAKPAGAGEGFGPQGAAVTGTGLQGETKL